MKYQIPRLLEFFKELNKKCMGKSLKLKTKSSRKKLKTQGQGGTRLSPQVVLKQKAMLLFLLETSPQTGRSFDASLE